MSVLFSDEDIVDLARIWLAYGGPPPSEIFLRFGVTVEKYRIRLRAALDTIEDCDPESYQRMLAYAQDGLPRTNSNRHHKLQRRVE